MFFVSFCFVRFSLVVVVVVAFVDVRVWAVCVYVRVCVCACLYACVFSPAASVDYGSFADRCSTWLELLRLKAHTIRRGSVKTSRRTQSLAHSGDQTHKYRTQSHKQSCTHTHMLDTLTHPSMHAAGGRSIVNQSTSFFS